LYTEAIASLEDNDKKLFKLLEGRAAVYAVKADRESQLEDIEAMLAIANEEGDDSRRVDALLGLASLYLETEPAKASQPLDQASQIARQLGDVGQEGLALYYFGMQAFVLFDVYKARDFFKESASKLHQVGKIAEMAESLSFLSVTLGDLGDQNAALKAAQEAADLSKETGDILLEAKSTRRLAIAFLNQYQNSQALPFAEAALEMFRKVGDISNEMHALNVLGIVKRRLGIFESAEEDFLRGLGIAESINNEVGIKWLIIHLLYVYDWFLGEYTRTLALFEVQEEKARQVENETLETELQLMKAVEVFRLGCYEEAFSIYESLLPYINQQDEVPRSWNLRRMIELYGEMGRFDQATWYLDQLGEIGARINNPFESANFGQITARLRYMEGGAANWLEGIEKISDVIEFYHQRNFTEGLGDALYLKAQLHLALLGEDLTHSESALECTAEALKCFEKAEGLFFMPEQIHFLHSRALRANGRDGEADEYLRQAYERMMMAAGNIRDDELRRSYLENVRDNRAIQTEYKERFG
jgi:tetratricopeptide (TPR) repeat protein